MCNCGIEMQNCGIIMILWMYLRCMRLVEMCMRQGSTCNVMRIRVVVMLLLRRWRRGGCWVRHGKLSGHIQGRCDYWWLTDKEKSESLQSGKERMFPIDDFVTPEYHCCFPWFFQYTMKCQTLKSAIHTTSRMCNPAKNCVWDSRIDKIEMREVMYRRRGECSIPWVLS